MSWTDRLWQARAQGWLTSEEVWQVLLDGREAPDPGLVVERVLRGLAAAYKSPESEFESELQVDAEPVVIMDLAETERG
jgi:hypothetical protein